MANIFDNLTDGSRLGPALQTSLDEYDNLDVATGYLDLRGWDNLADAIDHKRATNPVGPPVVRVLVGMVAPSDSKAMLDRLQDAVQPPKFGSDIHDGSKARARRDQLVAHLRNQLMRGLSTAKGQATLRTLKAQLTDGAVLMKVYTERPLHGKTYLFKAPGKKHAAQWGYVGSSNFTNAGLNRNLELNIDVQDNDANKRLSDWFTNLWDNNFSLEITSDIIQLIEDSWAGEVQPTPFEMYLRVCHALSEDAREGLGYVLPESMKKLLLSYQETAVRTLARRIVRRGGTMLGDVVGLGKTLTAVATALMLENAEQYTTLILCPKNLETMWQQHVDAYEVDGRVVPYSMADSVLPNLKRYNLVICDESHNLRNSGTQVYEAVRSYIERNTSKVLLLTATPYNLAFTDVGNQIGLYVGDDDDLGIVPSAALAANPNLALKVDHKTSTLAAFKLSEFSEDWRRLMSDHLVRRTRSFIKRTAKKETVVGKDGVPFEREYLEFANKQRFHFPIRVARPLSHDFADDDPARLMEEDETLDAVRALTLPRYRLADYDDPRKPHTEADAKAIADIKSGRGNVSGFVRIGLFKRLSSSGNSFILSLQRQRARNELFVYALDNGLPIPLGTFTNKQLNFTDEDMDDAAGAVMHGDPAGRYAALKDSLPEKTKWLNTGVFNSRLRRDLMQDNDAISTMLDRFGSWDSTRDSKVNALVDLLRKDHAGEKVLVFTEYADTADYLADALESAGIERVGRATGNTKDPSVVARRFSPVSNKLPNEVSGQEADQVDPIDVLVATDVLSEGQNLQDAHIVVNFDLPWAIIRIIQRAGRVDRVGQQSDVVYVYLISHEKVEAQINLRARIKARLGASAEAFGSDESFFGGEAETRILGDFYNGRVSDGSDDEGEADAVSEAWLIWSNALEKHPDIAKRVLAMPDLAQTTRDQYIHETRGSVTTYVSTVSGMDAFATSFTDDMGNEVEQLLTPVEALRVFQAQLDTPTVEQRDDHFDRQEALVHGPLTNETVAQGNLRGIRKWAWERLGGNSLYFTVAGDALTALQARPLTEFATTRLTQARRAKYSLDDLAGVLNQLHDDDRLVVKATEDDTIKIVCSLGVRD